MDNKVPGSDSEFFTSSPLKSIATEYNADDTCIRQQHPEARPRKRSSDRYQRAEGVVMEALCAHTEEQGSKIFKCHLLTEEHVNSQLVCPAYQRGRCYVGSSIPVTTGKLMFNHLGKLLITWYLAKSFTLQASYFLASTIVVPPLPTKHNICKIVGPN